MKSLKIKIGTVQKYFSDMERRALDKEMRTLEAYAEGKGGRPAATARVNAKRAGWAVKATSKIEHLARINKYEAIARELKRSIAALRLQVRNVSEIEQILAIADSAEDFREQPLESVRDTAAFEIFDKWNDMAALKALRESMKLVDWTKSTIHSKTELKTWVDLALMSTGESDIDAGKILTFSDAVKGYSPVIYDLSSSEVIEFEDFVKALNEVMETMKGDPIHTKIKDANRLLDWIKDISERHGSVETSSLKVLHGVNAGGVYEIRQDRCKGVEVTLNWTSGEEDSLEKVMSLGDLHELRSKLMLISVGEEAEVEVERFVTLLSEVETIAKHLRSLLAAGCNLFSEFTIKAFLREAAKVKVRLDFGHRSGLLNSADPVVQTLSQVAKFLERASASWADYISQMRAVHPGLNYFTTDQLVLLSSALARAKFEQAPLDVESLMLINYVCPAVATEDLVAILSGAEAAATAAHRRAEMGGEEEDDDEDDDDEEAQVRKTLDTFR